MYPVPFPALQFGVALKSNELEIGPGLGQAVARAQGCTVVYIILFPMSHLYCYRVRNFSEPLAAHYFTQASLAIIYLHERGVYHRDIKPENFVLDENFNLKLTDFGTNKVCAPPLTSI